MQTSLNSMRIEIDRLKESLFDAGYQDSEKENSLRSQLQALLSQLKTEVQSWEIQNISLVPAQSAQEVYYTIEIGLPDGLMTAYRKELPYLPNVQGRADIVTEDLSLLGRLFMPLRKVWRDRLSSGLSNNQVKKSLIIRARVMSSFSTVKR
jgi:hypothetical protein